MAMNYRTGFQRIYAVLSVVWIAAALVVVPTERIKFWDAPSADTTATLESIGRLVKQNFPGSYDDMSDSELGARIKKKYPNWKEENPYSKYRGRMDKPFDPSKLVDVSESEAKQSDTFKPPPPIPDADQSAPPSAAEKWAKNADPQPKAGPWEKYRKQIPPPSPGFGVVDDSYIPPPPPGFTLDPPNYQLKDKSLVLVNQSPRIVRLSKFLWISSVLLLPPVLGFFVLFHVIPWVVRGFRQPA